MISCLTVKWIPPVSIFNDNNYKSVIEIRKTGGEYFVYSHCESKILQKLIIKGAINPIDTDYEFKNNSSFGFGFEFGFGFDSLPSLDSMELDSNMMLIIYQYHYY